MSLTTTTNEPEPQAEAEAEVTASNSKPGGSRKRARLTDDTTDSPPFRGVRKRSWGRYVSEIRLPGQKTRIWLGSFGSPEMAARAYDSAAFFLKGTSATLNFPHLVHSLPRPLSSSRRHIQSAAAQAALLQLVRHDDHHPPLRSSNNAIKTDDEWWDQFRDESISATTSFWDHVVELEQPPLTVQDSPFSFGQFAWNEVFNFPDPAQDHNLLTL